jgi:hypothetical protein
LFVHEKNFHTRAAFFCHSSYVHFYSCYHVHCHWNVWGVNLLNYNIVTNVFLFCFNKLHICSPLMCDGFDNHCHQLNEIPVRKLIWYIYYTYVLGYELSIYRELTTEVEHLKYTFVISLDGILKYAVVSLLQIPFLD